MDHNASSLSAYVRIFWRALNGPDIEQNHAAKAAS